MDKNLSVKLWREKNKEHISQYNLIYRIINEDKLKKYNKYSNINKVNNQKIRRIHYFFQFTEMVLYRQGKVLSQCYEYKTAHSHLKIKCNNDHIFSITLSNLNKNRWCPLCNCHKNERYTKYILQYIFNKEFIKIRPSWLVNDDGNNLEIDIYNKELNLAVEYNGIQHYTYIEYFHKTFENFEKLKRNDKLKENILKNMNINFIIVPYFINNIYNYIIEKLIELNIDFTIPQQEPSFDNYFFSNEYLEKISKIISDKKGELLEGYYITQMSPIKIRCSNGHIWNTKIKNVLRGSWCYTCGHGVILSKTIKEKISKTRKEKIASGEIPKPPRKQKSIRVEISEKKCTKCSEIKTIDNFHIKKDTADGYQPYCRLCVNIAKKNFRENMKNEIFACDMCNKVYCLKDSLTRHKKEKH